MRYSAFNVSFMYYLLIYLSTYLPYVLGHGFVHGVVVGGQTYEGWNPFTDRYANPQPTRIVRKVKDDGYVSSTDVDIACHHFGNEGTSAIANAPAGSKITFNWANWYTDHQGPVSTYMASCTGGCSNFSASNGRWFKIDFDGYSGNNKWASDKLISNGFSWTSTIPAGLLPGEYLVRNEIVALHSAGNPQFYPSCSQVKVTGSGTRFPSDGDMVSMQRLYNGVLFPNIWQDPETTLAKLNPGPPLVNFDGNGDKSTTSTSQTLPTPTPDPASRPSGQCQLQRRRITD